MADINLLPDEERSSESFNNLRRKTLLVSVGLLVITGVLTVLLLVYYTVLSSQASALEARVKQNIQEIETLKAKEELIVVSKQKAGAADKILKGRVDTRKFFESFAGLVPQNVYFSDIKIIGGKLSASGKARTSNDMAGFVASLVSQGGSELVSNVNVDSLSSDDSGSYAFSINMQLAGREASK